MVKKILQLLYNKVSGLHEAAYLLAVFAFLSQLFALVRDRLLAHFFGAGITLDIYYAAFRIPDFVFVSVASIVSLFVLIPFLTDKIARDKKDARRFLSSITSAFFIFIVAVSVVLFFITPWLTAKLYPGFTSAAAREPLILVTRVLLLSPILLGLSNILASVTQVFKRFYVYALSPIVYNIGIIVGIVFLRPQFGITGVAFGVILGALLHLGVQVPVVLRDGLLPTPTLAIRFREVWSVVWVSLPRTIALSVSQVAILALLAIASLMPEGSISIFNFALNLQGAPLTIIGVSYSVAAFPTLARLFSNGERKEFLEHMVTAIRHVLFWSFPAMALFIVLRAQIVRTVLGSGAFDWADTRLTAAALALFVISLFAHALMLLFVRGYYASGRTRRPLVINTLASVATILFAYLGFGLFRNVPAVQYFVEALFRVTDVPGTIVLVLPFAFSLGMIGSVFVFWLLFRRDFGGHLPRFLYTTIWQSFSSGVLAGGAAFVGLQVFAGMFDQNTILGVFFQGLLAGILGIVVGSVVLRALGSVEFEEVWHAARHKFWKEKPVLPEQDEL